MLRSFVAVHTLSGRDTYDDLYRLTREDITDPVNGNAFFAYTYDAVANRLTKEDVNGVVTSTYDLNDRILTEGVNTYTYDLNGNTLSSVKSGVTTTYSYDYQNRMIGADDGTKLVNYGYNADGIRRWSEVDGVRTTFLVDQNRPYAQVLEELDAGFNPTVTYVHGDDLLSQFRSGQRYTYHYDGHGSTTALTDTTEAVTDTYLYDAWGELLASTGATPNHYLYTGEQYDPNVGFYYLRARYYNPSLGRFHTMDTWGGMQFEPVSLHKYLYANADPVLMIDPSGLFSLTESSIAQGIQNLLSKMSVAVSSFLKVQTIKDTVGLFVAGYVIGKAIYNPSKTHDGIIMRAQVGKLLNGWPNFSFEFRRKGFSQWPQQSTSGRGYDEFRITVDEGKGGGVSAIFDLRDGSVRGGFGYSREIAKIPLPSKISWLVKLKVKAGVGSNQWVGVPGVGISAYVELSLELPFFWKYRLRKPITGFVF